MDKYEFNIKVEQIKKLVNKKDFATAMKIADTIDWRRVRNANLLSMISQVYEKNREYQEAKEVLLLAFERAPIGKRLLYKLTELALREGSVAEAEDYYREFCDMAPEDTRQHILRYMLLKEKKAPVEQLIHALERYTSAELDEKWMYELAELYARAGRTGDCIQLCDKMILMFGVGTYVDRAMELKQRYAPLTNYQQDLVQHRGKYEEKLRAVEEEYENGVPGMQIYEEQDVSGSGFIGQEGYETAPGSYISPGGMPSGLNQGYMYGAGGNVQGAGGYVQSENGYVQPEGGYTAGIGNYVHPQGGYGQGTGNYVRSGGGYVPGSGSYAQPDGGYAAEGGSYIQTEGGYGAGAGSYAQAEGSYGTGAGNYVQGQSGYAAGAGSYAQAEGGYGTGAGNYVQGQSGYAAGAGSYAQAEGGYGAGAGSYAQAEGGYENGAENFVQPGSGYADRAGSYVPAEGSYTTGGRNYVPAEGVYTASGGNYAPTERRYGARNYVEAEDSYAAESESYVGPEGSYEDQSGSYMQSGKGYVAGGIGNQEVGYGAGTGNYGQPQDSYTGNNYARPVSGGGFYGGTAGGYNYTDGRYMEENGSYGSGEDGSYPEQEAYYSDNNPVYQRDNFVDEEVVASLHQAAAEKELAAEMSKISTGDYVEQEPQSGRTKVFRQRANDRIAEAAARRAAEKEKETKYHDRVYTPHHLMIEAKSPEAGFETAVDVLKKIHQKTGVNNQVIKITGSKLSNRGVFNVSDKLAGKDLIVEEAGDLRQEDLEELQMLLERDETGMIVVLIDNPYQMKELHHQNPGFINLFECINADGEESESQFIKEDNYYPEEEVREEPVSETYTVSREASDDHREAGEEIEADEEDESVREDTEADEEDTGHVEKEEESEDEEIAEEEYSDPEAEEEYPDDVEDGDYAEEEYEDSDDADYEDGYEDGCEEEYEDGYEDGCEEEYEDGYDAHYEDGYDEEQEYDEESETEYERSVDDEELDLNDFADYAVKYANEIDCSITGKSMLALYERIEIMEEDGIPLTRANAEDLIEEAADKAEKPSLGGLIKGVFSSKYDKDGLLILKEEHFI